MSLRFGKISFLYAFNVFLSHQVLLYILDGSAFDDKRTPATDLVALLNELELYSKRLIRKPSLVFINKSDVEGECSFVQFLKECVRVLVYCLTLLSMAT